MPAPVLVGCDFSSAPTPKKTIVLAIGELRQGRVQLSRLERFASLSAFSNWLKQAHSWVGAFDLPFGLPRELVQTLGWPTGWAACMAHYGALSRDQIRQAFATFCNDRPVGGKFAHRATDGPAGSSPSMKWVNPPVAFMLHAGVPLLLQAGVTLPGLSAGMPLAAEDTSQPLKIALEGYPGMLAREVLGQRSYKADDKARQTLERLIARKDLITALEQGHTRLDLRLKLTHAQRDALADDARGDALDAVLCLMQAAWAQTRHDAGDALYGLPPDMDPLEGWIVSA
ncbi:DUF429 domain-containing protein [Rhodoferax sp.]|uniref:DUF429 domain-containing protein n=1 Tax=Rhodoferax sp. TaxID=50421 RepID=UPI0025FDC1CC|nr:DUF429 domain-containing protein [Rhodoferax sp.]MCM2340478.1 DUF429 domain-containing protein [Rhodoferax sp.]